MEVEYMRIALEQAQKGALNGEIPVGAVIVYKDKVVSKSYNKKEITKCSVNHAEILAIEEASKKLNDWRLNECDMYLTMEPCLMCCGALIQARIKNVYYLLDNEKFGGKKFIEILKNKKIYNHQVNYIKINDKKMNEEAELLIKNFFLEKR